MTQQIQSWTDGYLALRDRAYDTRGSIALDTGGKWPRTTGDEVVEIAALFDPSVRDIATPGLLRRWTSTLDQIRAEALGAPTDTYPENRTFWTTLEIAAVALDEHAYPLPPARMWKRALYDIGTAPTMRNAAPPPFGPFPGLTTYDAICNAQKATLGKQRGEDQDPPPPGFTGQTIAIPRSTNADVLELASWWGDRLDEAPTAIDTEGFSTTTVKAEWQTAMADVDALAKSGEPDAVYPKNNEFWRTLRHVSVQIASAMEAPSTWDNVVASVGYGITHVPQTLEGAASSAGSAVKEAATAIGGGLVGALKNPLYLGAGLVGLYFLTRNRSGASA